MGAAATDDRFRIVTDLRRDVGDLIADRLFATREDEPEGLGAESRLTAAVANTLTGDTPGLLGQYNPPTFVAEAVARRQADAVALVNALSTTPMAMNAGYPLVPELAPAVPASVQAGEKTEFSSRKYTVGGTEHRPDLVACVADLSWAVARFAGDAIAQLLIEDCYAGLSKYLVDHLAAAAGTAHTTIPEALAAIEATGAAPDLVVTSRSAWARLVPGSSPAAYPNVVFGPTGDTAYVVATGGLFVSVTDPPVKLLATRPTIGAVDMSASAFVIFTAATGSVAGVTPGP